MPHGGRRKGSGRPPVKGSFRQFCREVTEDPTVRRCILRKAKKDGVFALKVSEAAWGRPPQAIDVNHRLPFSEDGKTIVFVATFADGTPLPRPTDHLPGAADGGAPGAAPALPQAAPPAGGFGS